MRSAKPEPARCSGKVARGRQGARRTRAAWDTWSEGSGEGRGTSLATPGTLQVGQRRPVGFLAGKGHQTRAPGVSPVPHRPTAPPRRCGTRDRTLPHAAGSSSSRSRVLSRGARTTCSAANRRRRLIQSELLKGAATPPPLPGDRAEIALSGWALPVFYRSVVFSLEISKEMAQRACLKRRVPGGRKAVRKLLSRGDRPLRNPFLMFALRTGFPAGAKARVWILLGIWNTIYE